MLAYKNHPHVNSLGKRIFAYRHRVRWTSKIKKKKIQ